MPHSDIREADADAAAKHSGMSWDQAINIQDSLKVKDTYAWEKNCTLQSLCTAKLLHGSEEVVSRSPAPPFCMEGRAKRELAIFPKACCAPH